ncbi:DUF7638 domain-containing protein [Saccharibacillus sacchari]|uniref:DUF7638 domain-containing protein n=1 Tax=Saccharibacillus sacchari TaxID=456493 RepID=UPI0004B93C0E|nr:hypothetical protein [Saccharibacillus sacchari]
MQRIQATRTLQGTTVAGLIHNGGQYFYVQVEIYEDGTFDCWERVDLAGVQEKIHSGWLVSSVPAGQTLSIHGLGAYRLKQAEWLYDAKRYVQHLLEKVKELNPHMLNVYTMPEDTDDNAFISKRSPFSAGKPIRDIGTGLRKPVEGKGFHLLKRTDAKVSLVELVLYANGSAVLYEGAEEHEYSPWEKVLEHIDQGILCTQLKPQSEVHIPDLGTITVEETLYDVDVSEKRQELIDEMNALQGKETSLEACRQAYIDYLIDPNKWARQRLKEAYEKVPEHLRMYLGSMDDKDSDYVRIIDRPHEKREV